MRAQRMGQMKRQGISSALVLGMVLALGSFVTGTEVLAQHTGQHTPNPPPTVTNQPITPPNTTQPGMLPPIDNGNLGISDPGVRAHMEAERLKASNDDRQKKLKTDVEKLVSLTNELKTDVDKTNKDELSLDVIRKAQEIEKLAHDVQSRMKN